VSCVPADQLRSSGRKDSAAFEGYERVLAGQLDLFAHSRTVVLLNDLMDSVLERDAAGVRRLLELLRAEAPGHPALNSFGALREALERWPASTNRPGDTARIAEWLDSEVARAAAGALGPAASTFMRSLWHELAVAVAAQPYDPTNPRAHFAYCYLRAGEMQAALQALATIEDHDLDPFVLQCLILARYGVSGWHVCRSPFFTLALTAPQHLPTTLTALSDPSLHADWERFWTDCIWLDQRDEMAGAWFPAWYLIEHPATRMAGVVTGEESNALWARAFRAMRLLLVVERNGYAAPLIAARTELRRIDSRLFELYMSRREAQGSGQ
jgi:hypothetical protein